MADLKSVAQEVEIRLTACVPIILTSFISTSECSASIIAWAATGILNHPVTSMREVGVHDELRLESAVDVNIIVCPIPRKFSELTKTFDFCPAQSK